MRIRSLVLILFSAALLTAAPVFCSEFHYDDVQNVTIAYLEDGQEVALVEFDSGLVAVYDVDGNPLATAYADYEVEALMAEMHGDPPKKDPPDQGIGSGPRTK